LKNSAGQPGYYQIGSNQGMNAETQTDHRITELEIKASFLEDQIDQLDQVVVRQQSQIDLLIREVTQLRQQTPEPSSGAPRNLRDELPPHF
jgi:SlyX protein